VARGSRPRGKVHAVLNQCAFPSRLRGAAPPVAPRLLDRSAGAAEIINGPVSDLIRFLSLIDRC
jgi:hypothetical protein